MPRASTRAPFPFLVADAQHRPSDDPIFALNAEAQRRARAGESVVNATLGALMQDDGMLAVMPCVSEVLRAVEPRRAAAYAPIAGEPGFLSAVIGDLFGNGELASWSLAAATPGGTGALHHAIVNFLEPGDALLTTEFHWGPYQTLAEHTRRRVETFRMFGRDARFDADAFHGAVQRQIATQKRALILLNSPCHNPTGYSLDSAEWDEVVRVVRAAAERAPVALLVDHAYAKFGGARANEWVEHVAPLVGEALLLVAWTASKSFTQYGARVGALVAVHPDADERRRVTNALSFSCRGTWSNCNHAGMLAISSLLNDATLRARADRERDVLRAVLDERVRAFNAAASGAGLAYPRYEGGFFVSVFTPAPEKTAARMRELGVFVVPISGAVRVALCSTPARDVPRLVQALAYGLEAAGK
ncbi:MAG: aminotransferase class I/II-fold pyridoxal phosphate-dependent enzyme [Planctomycetes bacterium]|nr:aminotransferase class I/II-fold pyridoxal phosphate-dependent enzyme [Planctomycetota bacterium]